jgi:hypothetical protein
VGRRYYWRLRACGERNCSEYSRPWWINLGRSDKDFNGDGYADVAVGAYHTDDNGKRDAGRAYVYFGGSINPFEATPDGVFAGEAADDHLGFTIASVGDFNGDGFADLVVGAPGNDAGGSNAGRAYLYFGGAGATMNTVADAIFTGAAVGEELGRAVASAGDVNADGFSDVMVSMPGNVAGGAGSGRVHVYFGGNAGPYDAPSGVLTGRSGETLAETLSAAGDMNGDGFADIAASTFPDGIHQTKVQIYLGGEGSVFDRTVDLSVPGAMAGDYSKISLASGDVSCDGFSDLVVGTFGNRVQDTGHATAYFGSSVLDDMVDGLFSGSGVADGVHAIAIGGLNSDSCDDLVVGHGSTQGGEDVKVELFLGRGLNGISPTSSATLVGAVNVDFSATLASDADLNADGIDDLVVGSPNDPTSGFQSGRVYLFLGRRDGSIGTAPFGTLDAGIADSFFGSALAR